MEEVYLIIESALDEAFLNDRYILNFYEYLKSQKATGKEVKQFITSTTAATLSDLVQELEDYVSGGDKQLIEAYKHVGKPRARKIKNYMYKILTDAWQYENDKKPGRRKGSTNKKNKQFTNK
jgi:hypothetical protein